MLKNAKCLASKRTRGTTANSFLFLPGSGEDEQIGSAAALLVHPPGASFAEPYLEQLEALVPSSTAPQHSWNHYERDKGNPLEVRGYDL